MDYLLADEISVSPGEEHMFTEKVWRLPHTRLCYTPPAEDRTPAVAPSPWQRHGHVTFGCFQRLTKITDAVLANWGRIFTTLPEARLVLQGHQTGRPVFVAQILARLAGVGIAANRVTVKPPASRASYLESYAEVDIILDTFPYTGATTTCEALWMGVPTVTLRGNVMVARQGAALMTAAGLPGWVADDHQQYVEKACDFAADLPGLATLRGAMRAQVRASPLFDTSRFAINLGNALVDIWRDHTNTMT